MEQFKENNTESKIIFFENQNESFSRPPHDPTHTACSTPNPPWWCEEQGTAVSVDDYVPFLILIGVVVALVRITAK